MLYEVTVHPGVFDRVRDDAYWNGVAHVLQGMIQNCICANLWNGELLTELRRRLSAQDHCSADPLTRLLSRLKDMRRIILRPPEGASMPKNNAEWMEQALLSHARNELFCILARGATLDGCSGAQESGICVPIERAGINDLWNRREHTRQVRRCANAIMCELRPVLQASRRVRIVDYVICRAVMEAARDRRRAQSATRFRDGIRDCLKAWLRNAKARVEFVIETEGLREYDEGTETLREFDPEECRVCFEAWRRALRTILPKDTSSIKIRFWSSVPTRSFQRNRFLITEIAGVKVGKGFDFFPGDTARQTDLLTLLPEVSVRDIEKEFSELKLEYEMDLR